MTPLRAFAVACAAVLATPLLFVPAFAQTPPAPAAPISDQGKPAAPPSSLTEKTNAYVGCINRQSARAYDSRRRYFSWVSKNGPTGKERIIYGLYTIYDTSDCRKDVEKANALEPRDAELEAAASAYAATVSALEPLLQEAYDYYNQEDYKDDKMAKGRALHPRLIAAWNAFESADKALRSGVETINDRRALERIASIEKSEGRTARYHFEALMVQAKRLYRATDQAKPDVAAITAALAEYEATAKALEGLAAEAKIDSFFISASKAYLTSAKQVMRRIRDKVPFSQGDRMMINAGGGEMIEGTPQRLLRDYNSLIEASNSLRR
jgi:predicted  nucleic acid-binding Zn-ribbon protein